MKTLKGLLILLMTLSFSNSFAGDKGGNGGDGIFVKGRLFLLDFVEAGIEQSAYIDKSVVADPEILRIVSQKFAHIPSAPMELIAKKLSELNTVDPVMAKILSIGLSKYSWRVVDKDLFEIYDEDSPLKIPSKEFVQLAVRREGNVFINKNRWQLLDEKNKVGLIFHELIYAFIPFERDNIKSCLVQSSYKARSVVGNLFLSRVESDSFDNGPLAVDRLKPSSSKFGLRLLSIDESTFASFSRSIFRLFDSAMQTTTISSDSPTLDLDIQSFVTAALNQKAFGNFPGIMPLAKAYEIELRSQPYACFPKASVGLEISVDYPNVYGSGRLRSINFGHDNDWAKELTLDNIKISIFELQRSPIKSR